MEKIVNLLGIRQEVTLCHFESTYSAKNPIVMIPITEEEELKIDKSSKIYGNIRFIDKNNNIIGAKHIHLYGEVDLDNEDDVNHILEKDLIDEGLNQNWIHSNFDYNKGVAVFSDGRVKGYCTRDPLLWFKYNHCLLGKPKRIIIYDNPVHGRLTY